MKKLSLIAMLTLLIAMLSFQSFAQNISSVIISGRTWGSGNVIIEITLHDNFQ
jgi:ABC-type proline/glycine betaine transport system substrate-binding protein